MEAYPSGLKGWFGRHPVVVFYVLAFVISWLGWIPQALHSAGHFSFDNPIFSFLGAGGPTLAAVIVAWGLEGRDGPGDLFSRLLKWRVAWYWYVGIILFWFAVAAAALGLGVPFGASLPPLGRFAWPTLLPILLAMVLSNVWEEIGWRGFALPRLQARYGDLRVTWMMGLLWSLWHLPLMLNPTLAMADLPWYGEVLFSLALTVLYTWLYNYTRPSLIPVTLFHAMSNTVAFALVELGFFVSSYLYVVGVTAVVSGVIVLVYGPRRFVRAAVPVPSGTRPPAAGAAARD